VQAERLIDIVDYDVIIGVAGHLNITIVIELDSVVAVNELIVIRLVFFEVSGDVITMCLTQNVAMVDRVTEDWKGEV
jgi:hypothetical protein